MVYLVTEEGVLRCFPGGLLCPAFVELEGSDGEGIFKCEVKEKLSIAIRGRVEGITVSSISTDVSIQISSNHNQVMCRDGLHMVCKVFIETGHFFISRAAVRSMTGYDMHDRDAGETDRHNPLGDNGVVNVAFLGPR